MPLPIEGAMKALSAAAKFAKENPKIMAAGQSAIKNGAQRVESGQSIGNAAKGAVAGQAVKHMNQQMAVTTQAKGGVVRKGGRYYLHKGEKVVSKRSVPKVTKAMQKAGMTLRHKGKAAVKKVPFIPMNKIRNMANGGTILKTGLHLLKPGQRVIPASKAAKARKAIKAAKK